MVFTHDTTINPIQIILKSNQGNQKNGSMKSSLHFDLNQTILVPNNVDCYVQLESFKFVSSFYNINSTNDTFYYSIDTGSGLSNIYGFTIPVGNYNITAFIDYLNTQLAGSITITSSTQTFKLTKGAKILILPGKQFAGSNKLPFNVWDYNFDQAMQQVYTFSGGLSFAVVFRGDWGEEFSFTNPYQCFKLNP